MINENKYYLGQKTGDILTAVQSLSEDAPNLGNRALLRATQGIINQIRRILHGRWDDEDVKYLKTLQKAGVALCKAIDSKEEMDTVISSVAQTLEDMLSKMEVPVNSMGSETENDGQEPPMGEEEPLTPGMNIEA